MAVAVMSGAVVEQVCSWIAGVDAQLVDNFSCQGLDLFDFVKVVKEFSCGIRMGRPGRFLLSSAWLKGAWDPYNHPMLNIPCDITIHLLGMATAIPPGVAFSQPSSKHQMLI